MTNKSSRKQQKIDFMIKLGVVWNPLFTLETKFVPSPMATCKKIVTQYLMRFWQVKCDKRKVLENGEIQNILGYAFTMNVIFFVFDKF